MKCVLDETNTFTANFSLLTSIYLIAFLNIHTREKQYPSLKYTIYANALNNTYSYTHVSIYMVCKVHLQDKALDYKVVKCKKLIMDLLGIFVYKVGETNMKG